MPLAPQAPSLVLGQFDNVDAKSTLRNVRPSFLEVSRGELNFYILFLTSRVRVGGTASKSYQLPPPPHKRAHLMKHLEELRADDQADSVRALEALQFLLFL